MQQPSQRSQEVVDYLLQNPEFLVEHQDLLAGMNWPQSETSFHDRQIQALRERQDLQRVRFDEAVDTAKNNQNLEQGLHQLALGLLSRAGLAATAEAAEELVAARFAMDHVAIFLPSQQDTAAHSPGDYSLLCQRVAHLSSVCDDRISTMLGGALFPNADTISSCAFIPLVHDLALGGVMVLGAPDRERFQPNMGVLILDRLGQLVGAYLHGRALL